MTAAFFYRAVTSSVERLAQTYARKSDANAEAALLAFEGQILTQWMRTLPLPPEEIVEVVSDIMDRARERRREIKADLALRP